MSIIKCLPLALALGCIALVAEVVSLYVAFARAPSSLREWEDDLSIPEGWR